ncbi:predicted protein [Candida tropicalis MYA-3404]|uniref:Pre-mRNA processing factor 4 (PRP4)-like domain-containing protein n=1 Tax=Candida tropicalis (strain ATCC MYA-3404 / T1) TaxID=294747 RepID=C5MIL1_CANTT|nr:predicted protein [Candida tropicalis MYA-3404]EER30505.1 predicted protein [Candida tropicalis MYA-3404]KAG4406369.1 hypothetical protein JTP64_003753 [Candida tropicalis]
MDFKDIPVINDNIVPESDEEIRQQLKNLGQPMVLPGEDDEARKQRLITLTTDQDMMEGEEDEEEDNEEFYTPGPSELYDVRLKILKSSLIKASTRLDLEKEMNSFDYTYYLKQRRNLNLKASKFELFGSQMIKGNTRAISTVRFSPNDEFIASGSWDGSICIMNSKDLSTFSFIPNGYHSEKVTLDWDMNSNKNVFASGGNEGNLNIWEVSESQLKPSVSIKQAHDQRITKSIFHPINDYLVTSSSDKTWKLWDINNEKELMVQEGHTSEVISCSIHQDGSLLFSAGKEGRSFCWDLRSGRSVFTLRSCWRADFCNNHLVTGDANGVLQVMDLRKNDQALQDIPAHTKPISDVHFYHQRGESNDKEANGKLLISSSFDGNVNIWSVDNWIKVKSLKGHDRSMSCDINGAGDSIVSSGWDRTVKLWNI